MAKTEERIKIGTSCKIIEGSGRENHYGVFAGSQMIGDTSGASRKITPLEACEYLSDEALTRRGFNKSEIKAEAEEYKSIISRFQEMKGQAKTHEEREDYNTKIGKAQKNFERIQKERSIPLNFGLITALCIKEHLGSAGVSKNEEFFHYSNETMRRLEQEGWKFRSIN